MIELDATPGCDCCQTVASSSKPRPCAAAHPSGVYPRAVDSGQAVLLVCPVQSYSVECHMANHGFPVQQRRDSRSNVGKARCVIDSAFVDSVDCHVNRIKAITGIDKSLPAFNHPSACERDHTNLADTCQVGVCRLYVDGNEAAARIFDGIAAGGAVRVHSRMIPRGTSTRCRLTKIQPATEITQIPTVRSASGAVGLLWFDPDGIVDGIPKPAVCIPDSALLFER